MSRAEEKTLILLDLASVRPIKPIGMKSADTSI